MRFSSLSRVVAGLCLASGSLVLASAPAVAGQNIPTGANVTFTATSTVTPAPAVNFAASSSGDGWGLAFTSDNVYNIFHHSMTTVLECHVKTTGAECDGYPKTVQDGSTDFSVGGQPSMWIDTTSNTLYVYAVNVATNTGGVVAVDLTSTNANPFSSFTALTGSGEAPIPSNSACGESGPTPCYAMLSNGVLVGSKFYAFNYVPGTPSGTQDQVLCFDTVTKAACAGQPFAISLGESTVGNSITSYPNPYPAIAAYGGNVYVYVLSTADDGSGHLACFTASSHSSCAGSWPAAVAATNHDMSAAYPILSNTGVVTGVCVPSTDGNTGTSTCFTTAGVSTTTPAGVDAALSTDSVSRWNAPATVIGARVYYTAAASSAEGCYDYATGASCANFPISLGNIGAFYTYTTNVDPANPSCLWINSDSGSTQIVNFDPFTGGACSSTTTRIQLGNFVVPSDVCTPTTYQDLTIVSPLPSAYTGGTVEFQDGSGAAIPNVATQNIDANGHIDLSSLGLQTAHVMQMVVSLPGAETSPIEMHLTWDGTYDPSCVGPNTEVSYTGSTTTTTTEALAFTGSNTSSMLWLGAILLMAGGVLTVATRRRTVGR